SSSGRSTGTRNRSRTFPLTCTTSSNVSSSRHEGSACGHGASHRRSCPRRSHNSSATCGAYGWSSDTAVSAANRAAGSSGDFDSSLTSSITAAIGVWNCCRRPRSSVTRAIVRWTRRVSGPSPGVTPAGALSATSPTRRQTRRRNPPLPAQATAPPQEPLHPFDSGRSPLHVLVGRTDEQDREPGRIGSVHLDQLVGCRGAAHALRDLRATLRDEAVAEEALERLAVNAQIELVQDLLEVAGIDQVHRRVVDPTRVVVDRHPV